MILAALYGIVPVWSIIGLNLFMLSTDKSLFVSVEVSILAGWLDGEDSNEWDWIF